MKILKLEPNETPVVVEIEGSLASMQSVVGGRIQAVFPFEVEFISQKESIDTSTPAGKFMLTIFAAVAELDGNISCNAREKVLQKQRSRESIRGEKRKSILMQKRL